MPSTVTVFCAICGQGFSPMNKAVGYRSLDRRWWCADETDCTDRAARQAITAAMAQVADTAALDQSWASLKAEGWAV